MAMEMTAVCLGKLAKTASFPHSHSLGDDLEFLFPQARLTSTSTKSVTYMPGTFCYRHARSHIHQHHSQTFGHLDSSRSTEPT